MSSVSVRDANRRARSWSRDGHPKLVDAQKPGASDLFPRDLERLGRSPIAPDAHRVAFVSPAWPALLIRHLTRGRPTDMTTAPPIVIRAEPRDRRRSPSRGARHPSSYVGAGEGGEPHGKVFRAERRTGSLEPENSLAWYALAKMSSRGLIVRSVRRSASTRSWCKTLLPPGRQAFIAVDPGQSDQLTSPSPDDVVGREPRGDLGRADDLVPSTLPLTVRGAARRRPSQAGVCPDCTTTELGRLMPYEPAPEPRLRTTACRPLSALGPDDVFCLTLPCLAYKDSGSSSLAVRWLAPISRAGWPGLSPYAG